ncbi:unknown [Prevotella sp. CAG:732]|nr:unknown [Prevotella sp. CAG:732]
MTKVYFTRHKTTIIQHFLHNYNSFLSKPSVNIQFIASLFAHIIKKSYFCEQNQ